MPTAKKKHKGLFLAFEGGEGAGKSTQINHLVRWLGAEGHAWILTRQPGGSPFGQKIREILLAPETGALDPRAELLLYEADRAHHVETVLRPALTAGKIVLCDRYADSSTVYQGICRKLGMEWTMKLNAFATKGLMPDLVFLLDVPETVGLERIKKVRALDRLEQETQAFHRQVRRGFLKLAKLSPRRFCVLDGREAEATLAEKIRQLVEKRLP